MNFWPRELRRERRDEEVVLDMDSSLHLVLKQLFYLWIHHPTQLNLLAVESARDE